LLTPLQSRPIVGGLGALRVVLASYWPALTVAACQVVVMYVVVHFGVGLHARYAVGTIAFLLLVSATFLAMIQAFNAVFGVAVGRVVTLAFLMIQLVSSGGIYPVETTAKPFQLIHPFDPMTYAVNGLRELTAGGVETRLWVSIVVLVGVLAVSLTASALAARRNRQYTMERLRPPIEV
jgi:putative membrane protein